MRDEEGIRGDCPVCGGEGEPLGVLGLLFWFRCVRCGIESNVDIRKKEKDR